MKGDDCLEGNYCLDVIRDSVWKIFEGGQTGVMGKVLPERDFDPQPENRFVQQRKMTSRHLLRWRTRVNPDPEWERVTN
jgi:hypothetical protein